MNEKRRVGRPKSDNKKKFSQIRVEEELSNEVRTYLPKYSKKVRFRVTLTGFAEKSLRETLDREKTDDKKALSEK